MKKPQNKHHKEWKELPYEIEHPEDSFFSTSNQIINNIKRRLFGIQHKEQIHTIHQQNNRNKHEKIEKILHNTRNIANRLAYSAHNGRNWERDNIAKMQRWLLNQLDGGRSLEILLAETMIRLWNGFHFVPAKELDTEYKIDLISRLPVKEDDVIRSIAFGIQVTMANLQWESQKISNQNTEKRQITSHKKNFHNNKQKTKKEEQKGNINLYQEKYEQIKNLVPFLQSSKTQNDIHEKYGRLSIPQIIGYTVVNGRIQEILRSDLNPSMDYFRKWRKNNFKEDGLLDFFKKEFQDTMMVIANNILETERYILSKKFFDKSQKSFKWHIHFWENDKYEKIFNFSLNEKRVSLILKLNQEIIMKTTFFLTEADFKKLWDIHYNNNN